MESMLCCAVEDFRNDGDYDNIETAIIDWRTHKPLEMEYNSCIGRCR